MNRHWQLTGRAQPRVLAVAVLIASLLVLGSCGAEESDQSDGTQAAERTAGVDLAKARSCAQQVTVLFWPDGHPAIASISFPSLAMPHVEIYRGTDPAYPMSAALAWAFTSPPGPGFPARSTEPQCLSDVSTNELSRIQDPAASEAAVRLVCRLPRGAQIVNEESGPRRYRFAVLDPSGQAAVDGVVGSESSRLRYSAGTCERTSPPKP